MIRDDCTTWNTTVNVSVTKQIGLAQGVPGLVCLLVSVIGLVAELLFVCRKKNNLLLRLFVYLTVAAIASEVLFSLFLLVYVHPEYGALCTGLGGLLNYPSFVEFLFKISIDIALLYKVYISHSYRARKSWYKRIVKTKTAEAIYVLACFVLPMAMVGAVLGEAGNPKYWALSHECQINFTDQRDCKRSKETGNLLDKITEYIPVAIELFLSIITIGTLLIWLSWLKGKQYLRSRMSTVVQEVGPLLAFLMVYSSLRVVLEVINMTAAIISRSTKNNNHTTMTLIAFVIYPLNHAIPPVIFLVYMCILCTCKSRKRERRVTMRYSTEEKTTPESFRVSLPSETAAHAPNFLSPSTAEPTVVTSLLVN